MCFCCFITDICRNLTMAPQTKTMASNIQCEYEKCSRKVQDTRTTCGYHKRHTRFVPSYTDTLNHSQTIFINNIIIGCETCYQFENEVDLGIEELRPRHIVRQSLLFWKLPCNNRTKLASTNKNRDHLVRGELHGLVIKKIQLLLHTRLKQDNSFHPTFPTIST